MPPCTRSKWRDRIQKEISPSPPQHPPRSPSTSRLPSVSSSSPAISLSPLREPAYSSNIRSTPPTKQMPPRSAKRKSIDSAQGRAFEELREKKKMKQCRTPLRPDAVQKVEEVKLTLKNDLEIIYISDTEDEREMELKFMAKPKRMSMGEQVRERRARARIEDEEEEDEEDCRISPGTVMKMPERVVAGNVVEERQNIAEVETGSKKIATPQPTVVDASTKILEVDPISEQQQNHRETQAPANVTINKKQRLSPEKCRRSQRLQANTGDTSQLEPTSPPKEDQLYSLCRSIRPFGTSTTGCATTSVQATEKSDLTALAQAFQKIVSMKGEIPTWWTWEQKRNALVGLREAFGYHEEQLTDMFQVMQALYGRHTTSQLGPGDDVNMTLRTPDPPEVQLDQNGRETQDPMTLPLPLSVPSISAQCVPRIKPDYVSTGVNTEDQDIAAQIEDGELEITVKKKYLREMGATGLKDVNGDGKLKFTYDFKNVIGYL